LPGGPAIPAHMAEWVAAAGVGVGAVKAGWEGVKVAGGIIGDVVDMLDDEEEVDNSNWRDCHRCDKTCHYHRKCCNECGKKLCNTCYRSHSCMGNKYKYIVIKDTRYYKSHVGSDYVEKLSVGDVVVRMGKEKYDHKEQKQMWFIYCSDDKKWGWINEARVKKR